MPPRRRKGPREKDLTSRYFSGHYDEDRAEQQERFSDRSKHAQQNKILKTAALQEERDPADIDALPTGEVLQVYSLYSQVEHENQTYLCTVRKTLSKISDTAIVV